MRKKGDDLNPSDIDKVIRIVTEHETSENALSTYEELLAEDPVGVRQEELILDATEALAQALRSSGLTRELAARLGKIKRFVSQILGGGKDLTLRTLVDVAGVLGCKVQIQLRAEKGSI